MISMTIVEETMMTAVTSRHVNRDSFNLIPKYMGFPLRFCKVMNSPLSVWSSSYEQTASRMQNKKSQGKISGDISATRLSQ
jgi:hypothetical protein